MWFDWAVIPVRLKRIVTWGIMVGFLFSWGGALYGQQTDHELLSNLSMVSVMLLLIPFMLVLYFKIYLEKMVPLKKRTESNKELLGRMKHPVARNLYSKKTRGILERRSDHD